MQPDIATRLTRPAAPESSGNRTRAKHSADAEESPSETRFARLVRAAEQDTEDAQAQTAQTVATPIANATASATAAAKGGRFVPSTTGVGGKPLPGNASTLTLPHALSAQDLPGTAADALGNTSLAKPLNLPGNPHLSGAMPGGLLVGGSGFGAQPMSEFARTAGLAQRLGESPAAAQAGERSLVPIAGESFSSAAPAFPPSATPGTGTSASAGMLAYDVQGQVGRPGWDAALSERLLVMTEKGINRASLRLHPQHLGPVEVSISMARDEVNVSFQAQSGVTREAIEQALPKLREMLSESGLSLADTNVSAQQHQSSQQPPSKQGAESKHEEPMSIAHSGGTQGEHGLPDPVARHQRLLDAYA